VSAPEQIPLDQFLESASERLQFLREYSSLVQEAAPRRDEIEQLFQAAHWLGSEAAGQGFPLFSEIAGRMAHVFQYALHAELPPESHGPLVEFLADAITLLEGDLIQIDSDRTETAEDVETFKRRYSFAFAQPAAQEALPRSAAVTEETDRAAEDAPAAASSLPSSSASRAVMILSRLLTTCLFISATRSWPAASAAVMICSVACRWA